MPHYTVNRNFHLVLIISVQYEDSFCIHRLVTHFLNEQQNILQYMSMSNYFNLPFMRLKSSLTHISHYMYYLYLNNDAILSNEYDSPKCESFEGT